MSVRMNSRMLVQALVRRVQQEGGFATVLHSGDDVAGAILLEIPGPDRSSSLHERQPDFAGGYVLTPVGTTHWGDAEKIGQYLDRRRRNDPDLWVIELDVANAEQLAADILLGG